VQVPCKEVELKLTFQAEQQNAASIYSKQIKLCEVWGGVSILCLVKVADGGKFPLNSKKTLKDFSSSF